MKQYRNKILTNEQNLGLIQEIDTLTQEINAAKIYDAVGFNVFLL